MKIKLQSCSTTGQTERTIRMAKTLSEKASKKLHAASRLLERAAQTASDGGEPTTITQADPVLEQAAIAQIEAAEELLKQVVEVA